MKRLVTTNTTVYDQFGEWLGKEVIEVDGFTELELKSNPSCYECGAYNGAHRDYFIKTGQCNAGSVEGYYKKCSRSHVKL